MDDDQQFCLRWNNHQSTLISVFDTLLENGTLVDCTLAAEGKFLKAHKVVLCACSPYFASLLSQQYDKHPIFILKDVKFQELRAMMDYMYRGEVNISQDQLAALLKAAESLQIKGLSDNRSGSSAKGVDNAQQQKQQVPVSGGAAGSAAKTGLTIEQNNKRPNAELPGDREGSTSPLSRKRKRVRRRSVDTNNAAATIDNHDQMSNSSSQSATQQAQPITSTPLTLSQITTATSAANVLNVTKKTDNNSNDDDDDDDDEEEPTIVRHKTRNTDGSNKDKIDSELLIEPKSEYEDGNDETVEDLTMADEELMEDMEQAGPSHGGEGSSQGYTQWQVDRSQDEVYLATQEAGQHRDAQGQAAKKRASVNAAVVPKTTPAVVPTIAKAQNGTSSVPSQPTAELPQSAASVSARKEPVAAVAAAAPNAKNDTENIKPDSGDGSSAARPLVTTQNPLTAIMNEKSMVLTTNQTRLTRQYRQRVRIKYSGERSTRVNLLNERSTTKENIPKAVKPSGTKDDTLGPMDTKLGENLLNMNKGDSSSAQTTASVKASAAAAHKVKKKARKIASATNVKIQRSYKIDGKSGDKLFPCRHCGRKYRWKSTLRRHENDECGNKEPSHQCPYCPYKAKQRGNLGVHVRKHHSDKPKLESCRKRKTI
ncbi:longitudinals lacking protein, isoforms F/I/K/T-like isoform X2 [Contarinia nasturtii]|uniref:longitudinals lacking protein, isoforms F/I/K/T-like isoform X2 n=1 Tax=Contarinia nasturtii TaxID=265458 RepID=UPI0012D3E129|nr:longitudinals lacking protein, isoforms F/I/K/T-like isoform X2 [Contarinia nasturtii]